MPRTFAPAPGWSPNGHRIKAPLDYERGPEKTWVYGALRVRDGKVLTRCAASRNSKGYIASLTDIEADNPTGDIFIVTDNLSSHIQCAQGRAHHQRVRFADEVGLDARGRADQGGQGASRRDDTSLTGSHHVRIGGNETRPSHHETNGTGNAVKAICGRLPQHHVLRLLVGQDIADVM